MRIRALYVLAAALIYLAPLGTSAANQTAVTTPSGSTHGGLVSGDLATATGTNTVTDSGLATANVPTLSGTNNFAALNTFSNIQFTGALNSPSGQLINGQYGDCLKLGGGNCPTAYNGHGQYVSFSQGTLAGNGVSPNGPLLRVGSVHNALTTDCNSNPVDGDCVANIMSFVYGVSTDQDQEVAISGKCETQTIENSSSNCIAFGGEGRVSGNGIAKGIGLAVGGRRETSTGGIQGAQITANNDVTSNCGIHVDGSGPCNGIWLVGESPGGAYDVGTGVHVAGPFYEGFTINGASDGGDGACCVSVTFHDDSTSPIGIEEDGTHSTAAIDVLAGAGPVILNANNIVSAGTVQAVGAPASAATGIVYGGTTAASSNCGSLSGAAGCVVIKVGIATHYLPYY